jgi:hypothetical protein
MTWGKQRFWVGTIATIPLLLIPRFVHSLTSKPEVHCQLGVLLPSQPGTYQTHPAIVVMQPWRGSHRVFGIFVVPDQYPPGHEGILSIAGTNYQQVDRLARRGTRQSNIKAPPGYSIVKVFIPTRAAISLIATGKTNQLKQPCNWTLTYQI